MFTFTTRVGSGTFGAGSAPKLRTAKSPPAAVSPATTTITAPRMSLRRNSFRGEKE
jgi:hypothetical protein